MSLNGLSKGSHLSLELQLTSVIRYLLIAVRPWLARPYLTTTVIGSSVPDNGDWLVRTWRQRTILQNSMATPVPCQRICYDVHFVLFLSLHCPATVRLVRLLIIFGISKLIIIIINVTVFNNTPLLSIVMKHMFINHVYVCIFITKMCFLILHNKETCSFRLLTLFPQPLVLFPAWEEGVYELARTQFIKIE